MTVAVLHGNCLELLAAMEPDSFDVSITDPPYELAFMAKSWDVVARLADELKARRDARAGVVDLTAVRRGKGDR